MRTFFYDTTVYFTLIALLAFPTDADPFEIQIFDGALEVKRPYTLISGKQYRLQARASDESVLLAQWFLSGNLGRITMGPPSLLTAVFVGEGYLICRVQGVKQRVKLRVVPETKIIGVSGGELQSPGGVTLDLPKDALAIERKIGIEIVAPPGLPPPPQRFVNVIRISPERLVLKRPGRLTFSFEGEGFIDAKPHLYFWETFGKRWVPLQGAESRTQGGVTTATNHFGIYALMVTMPEGFVRAERLQIQNVHLSPRVLFAPDRHRLTIAYQLNAPDATRVFVTMEVFDLRGRRVRRLLQEVPRYIGANAAQWDGLTDDGALVRNGRYLLVIWGRIGSQQAVHRQLIVVFK